MTTLDRDDTAYHGLTGLDRGLARGFHARKAIALTLLTALAVIGWVYLSLMIADMLPGRDMGALGPGMAIFNLLNGLGGMDELSRALLAALCAVPGASHFGMPATGAWGFKDLTLVFLMWTAMSGAMMLPTAAPLVTTYADIAEAAARKGMRAAPVSALVLGYLTVWIAFSALATLAQWALTSALVLNSHMAAASPVFAGSIFIAAGLYQFTPLKHACLSKCRNPFPLLFARWSDRRADVYVIGLREGVHCLGCCWALMLVMFAVGVMNVVWMVVLCAAMIVEKVTTGRAVPIAIGVVLTAGGFGIWGWILVSRAVIPMG